MRQYISYSYTSRKPMTQLDVKYCTIIEVEIPMKLVRLKKMYLNETHSNVGIGKHL
jgi:hypothetical protein